MFSIWKSAVNDSCCQIRAPVPELHWSWRSNMADEQPAVRAVPFSEKCSVSWLCECNKPRVWGPVSVALVNQRAKLQAEKTKLKPASSVLLIFRLHVPCMFLVLSLSLKAFPQTSISKSNPDTGLNADGLGRIENCWRTNLRMLAHLLQITAESSVSLQKGSRGSFFSFSFDHVCLLSLRPDWGGLCRVGFFPSAGVGDSGKTVWEWRENERLLRSAHVWK